MKKLILLTVLAAVLVAGCTGAVGPTIGSGQGLDIVDFYPSIDSVEGKGKSVTIYLDSENMGGSKISHAKACLMGSNFPGTDVNEGLWMTTSDQCSHKADLAAADTENNIPGGTFRSSWKLKSPCLSGSISRSDEFTGRVYYDYSSSALASVWIYSEDELISARQKGETIPTTLQVSKSFGPIDVDLDTTQPVRADDGNFVLMMTFRNVGSGTVFPTLSGAEWESAALPVIDEINSFTAKIKGPSALDGLDDCNVDELSDVELRRGDSIVVSCDIEIADPSSIVTKRSYPITVEADYGYYIDTTTSVTAKGRNEDCFGLSILSFKPGEVTNAPVDATISILFSEIMDTIETESAISFKKDGTTVTITDFVWSSSDKLVELEHADLDGDSEYEVSVGIGAVTVNDINLENPYTKTFKTIDTTDPGAPTLVEAVADGSNMKVTWTGPSDADKEKYNIYKNFTAVSATPNLAAEFSYLDSVQADAALEYIDNTGSSGTVFMYAVTTVDDDNNEGSAGFSGTVTYP